MKAATAQGLVLRLYVAGRAPCSVAALKNLHLLCDKYADGAYELEVVDVLSEPLRALSEGIVVTPTLVKVSPAPAQTVLGDLSEEAAVLAVLGLGWVRHE